MLELEDGRQIVDCISSWWVNIHGHSHPAIADALYQQAQQLEHVIFAGFTHEPAEQLARKLLHHLPPSLTRVFFSDNGSTAVEAALKMAYQYWYNRREQRNTFIGFEGGYHGDTLGAMSVGGSSPFWEPFHPLMFHLETVPFPATFDNDADVEAKESHTLETLAHLLEKHPDRYAGIFIEPLVQGVAGMRMCRPQFLQALKSLVHQFGVLLIYDEVMTGFGRTGDWFACLKSGTSPDIICLSKGISGGFLPLAVTLCTEDIYQSFYSDDPHKTLPHGHSYTGNPLSCAVALTSLELLEQNPKPFQEMERQHRCYVERWLAGHPRVEQVRTCGTIAAMEVTTDSRSDYFNAISPLLRQRFLEEGFLLRPLGNTIYIMPPYCITSTELESIYRAIRRVLDTL